MSELSAAPVTPAEARQIDQTCDRFEAAWKSGRRPDIGAYLGPPSGPLRTVLLRQLLLLDWDYRRRAGDTPRAADYHARFPGESELIDAAGREMASEAGSTRGGTDESDAGPPGTGHFPVAPDASDRYELAHEVGQGGIGVVFRGRDRLLGRELAVKVLREAYRDRPDARRRFADEARVGSQLQHPAIVPVYELGRFADGRPYFTMKLVEGHTLAALLRDRPEPGHDLPRYLGIFEQVCQATAYAHARGVVHRDLKPANVMVGAFGEVQVMDWGFAKVVRKMQDSVAHAADGVSTVNEPGTGYRGPGTANGTHSGALMGTPAYMPPEQARGETALIDARTDVFALGAILCEILTGRPPYGGKSADDVCRAAAAGDLADCYARLDASPADEALRRLARRCLAAQHQRPADGGAVARELTAYLATTQERLRQAEMERAAAQARETEARAKTRAERRARRMALALAAALLVGTTVATWSAVAANRARHTADVKEAETRAVLDFVQNRIFAAARPEGREGGLGRDVTLQLAVEAALPVVEHSFGDQPLIEARLRVTMGTSFRDLGDAKTAAEQFQRARTLFTQYLGPRDPATLDSAANLARCYEQLDRYPDALQLHQETLAARQATLGRDHPDALRSMHDLAATYLGYGRHAAAVELLETTLAKQQAALGRNHPDTLATMDALAAAYAGLDRFRDALRVNQETVELRKARYGPEHPDTLASMNGLASRHEDLKEYERAREIREKVLAAQRIKLGPTHPDTLKTIYSMANTYGFLKDYQKALELHRQVYELREAKLGRNHRSTIYSLWGVAAELYSLGKGAEAVPLTDECIARALTLKVQPDLVALCNNRSRYFEGLKDGAGCRQTAELFEKLGRPDPKSLFNAACYRAVAAKVIRATNRSPDGVRAADAEAERAMAWLQKAFDAGYHKADKMREDNDLEDLRGRADFRELLERMAKAK